MQAIKYFKQALDIRRKVEDRAGEYNTLYHIGRLYFEQSRYDIALGCFVLDKKYLDEVQHPYRDEAQIWIEKIQNELGDEQFATLLATVEPGAQEIVDQALNVGLDQ
jgi:tetratricopeptide (TPR) repeat protein